MLNLKLKRVKTSFQYSLSFVFLANLLCILEEGHPIEEYNAMSAIEI